MRSFPLTTSTISHPEAGMDSSAGIATGYGLDDRGVGVFSPCKGNVFFFFLSMSSSHTPIQWIPRALSPGVKRWGCVKPVTSS
jgi:hypothetical protein